MENLQEDLDCFQDENGQIENIYGEPRDPRSIHTPFPMSETQKLIYEKIREGGSHPFLK